MVGYDLFFVSVKGTRSIRIITRRRESKVEKEYLQKKIEEYLSKHSGFTFERLKKITCTGCLENISNQDGHTSFGGCLYDAE